MDRTEALFKRNCREWHAYFRRCAAGGRVVEVSHLFDKVAQYMKTWRDSLAAARARTREAETAAVECRRKEASIQLRLRMLGQLLTMMGHEISEMRGPADKTDKMESFSGGDNE